ncbi:hypothetical protein ACFE04_002528 [Oxalis oulophora]
MAADEETKTDVDSPTSVLKDDEGNENHEGVTGIDVTVIENNAASEEASPMKETQYTKLDVLLTKAQLYSEFLQEQMKIVEKEGEQPAEVVEEKKKGRGAKRRKPQYNSKRAKQAVTAMMDRTREEENTEDDGNLTLDQKIEKEQTRLVPLLTGAKMKDYQIKGLKWLISLWSNGLNGILADQMGLGKTIQTISLLAHLKGRGMHGPYLVVAPLSTLSNWESEIARFVPSMKAIVYHGDKKQRDLLRRKHMPKIPKTKEAGPDFPVVITSYEVVIADARRVLKSYIWKYVIVDEGHRLKNSTCKLVKEFRHVPALNRLILTGTPLQNNLAELWSLLHFILPDVFSSQQEFESWFDLSGNKNEGSEEDIEENRKTQVVAKLHSILRPFLLRRLKADVEQMLPRKKEIILYANMTDHQRNFQDHLVNKTLEGHLLENSTTGRAVMRGKLNNLMMQLRKNCNHPDLLEGAFDGSYLYPPVEQIVGQCGKFQLLERLLTKLFDRKHKFTKILDIMDYYFSEKGFPVCRIDGSVKLDDRRRQINDFNDVDSSFRIFLLSTRAGGLGINLTAADTCILYDSDWNPQMDLQAMDRCHRIGQTKPVHVYRLSTAQSVEGRILKRAFSKLRLEHVVIGKGQFHQEQAKATADVLQEEELIALLREEETEEDKMIQTDISDEDLERVLDRSDLLVSSSKSEDNLPTASVSEAYPPKGPGWEVVIPTATSGVLSTLN